MKRFVISHRLSAMKVGIDAVLLGAWTSVPKHGILLDAGCGCGIISLMLAQRSGSSLSIQAIDTDPFAIIESKENFSVSPWNGRLSARRADFLHLAGTFSQIVSNPPYFRAGVNSGESARMKARHAAALSPLTLLAKSATLLIPSGTLSLICPPFWKEELTAEAKRCGMSLSRCCRVIDSPGEDPVRLLLEFTKTDSPQTPESESLFIRDSEGEYSPEYRRLTRDFYLNF